MVDILVEKWINCSDHIQVIDCSFVCCIAWVFFLIFNFHPFQVNSFVSDWFIELIDECFCTHCFGESLRECWGLEWAKLLSLLGFLFTAIKFIDSIDGMCARGWMMKEEYGNPIDWYVLIEQKVIEYFFSFQILATSTTYLIILVQFENSRSNE